MLQAASCGSGIAFRRAVLERADPATLKVRMTAMLTADVDDADRAEGAMRGIQSLA